MIILLLVSWLWPNPWAIILIAVYDIVVWLSFARTLSDKQPWENNNLFNRILSITFAPELVVYLGIMMVKG